MKIFRWTDEIIDLLKEIKDILNKIYSAKDWELSQKYMSQWSGR